MTFEPVREHFLCNLRTLEAVLAGASIVETARKTQIARSTLSRLLGAADPHTAHSPVFLNGIYNRERNLHPAFQEVIRRL